MRILIIGGSAPVVFLCRDLASLGHGVTVIAANHDDCERVARRGKATVLRGDGTRGATLEEAGARSADALVAMTPKDHDNLLACQLARMDFGVARTVALVNDPKNVGAFAKLGVEAVCWSGGVGGLIRE